MHWVSVSGLQRWQDDLIWTASGHELVPDLAHSALLATQFRRYASEVFPGLHAAAEGRNAYAQHLRRRCRPGLTQRLGPRFEALVLDLVDRLPGYQCLARNLVLRSHGRTLGELDLLVQTPEGILHLEQTVKFYLAVAPPGCPDQTRWHGTLFRDCLDLKLNHLYRHQLPRVREAAVAAMLDTKRLAPTHSEALARGRLFSPMPGCCSWSAGQALVDTGLIADASLPLPCAGFWLSRSALARLPREVDFWALLPHADWMSSLRCDSVVLRTQGMTPPAQTGPPGMPDPDDHWLLLCASQEDLSAALETPAYRGRSIMVAGLVRQNGALHETLRGFIVSETWLQAAKDYCVATTSACTR